LVKLEALTSRDGKAVDEIRHDKDGIQQKDDGIEEGGSPPAVAQTVPCAEEGKGTKKQLRMIELQKLQSSTEQSKKPRLLKPTNTKLTREKAAKGGEEIKKVKKDKT
jgi:hypothetical protein